MKINIPSISFEVTNLCNLHCKYCYNHWKCDNNQISNFSNYTIAKKTLRKLFRVADVNYLNFTGGEPLMAERFLELVLYARMKGATVSIISNGTYGELLDYEKLVDLGVALFELPIHSYNATVHDSLSQHSGSWNKSITTIKKLLAKNAEVVAVIVLTKENCNDIGDTLKFIHSIGVKRVMINRVNIGGEAIKNTEDLLMTRDELNKAFETAALISKELKLSVTSNVCTPICILNPKNFKGIRFTSCSFDMKNRPITLDYKGNIRFCNHSPIELGNIFQHSLENIFNSRKVQEWKNAVPDFCMDCKAYDSCKAGCRAAAEQMGLSLNHPDPIINYMDLDHALLMKLKSNHSTSFGMQSQE